MKNFLTLFLAWLLAFSAMAETTLKASSALSAAGGYITSHNKVDGSFEDEITSWSASVGTIVKTASTEIQGNNLGVWSGTGSGTLDLQWTATASNTYDASAFVNVGGEDDVYVCAYVGTTETGCKLIPALDKIQKVSVVADSKLGEAFYLRLKHTGSDAFNVKTDDGKIEPQAFQNVQVVEQESVSYVGANSRDGSNFVKFTTKDTSISDNKSLIQDDNSGTATTYKILKNVKFNGTASLDASSAPTSAAWAVNHYSSSGAVRKQYYMAVDSYGRGGTIPFTGTAIAGDYFKLYSANPLTSANNVSFNITATSITDSVVQSYSTDRVGETIYSIQSVAPQGFISAQGSIIGKTTGSHQGDAYKALYDYAWAIASATAGEPYLISSAKGASAQADWDAGKTITIDESGLFTRASGGNAGAVGAKQLDAFQGHYHTFNYYNGNSTSGTNGTDWVNQNQSGASRSDRVAAAITDGTNGTPRTAPETRPVNVAKYVYIRYAQSVPTLLALPQSKENRYDGEYNVGGTIQSPNNTVLGNAVLTDTSLYTIPLMAGIFTVAPNVVVSVNDAQLAGNAGRIAGVVSVSTSQIVIRTSVVNIDGQNVKAALPFTIYVSKKNPDYQSPGVFVGNVQPEWQYDISSYVTGFSSISYAKAKVEKTADGSYITDFIIEGSVASATRSGLSVSISGVTASVITPINAHSDTDAAFYRAYMNNSNLVINHASTPTQTYRYSGRVRTTKPTWAVNTP